MYKRQAVKAACQAAKLVVSLEEHTVMNGLGSAVANEIACNGWGNTLLKLGLPDEYPHCVSPYPIMMEDYGLTAQQITETVRKALKG